jgi:hypothetical protein
MVLVLQLVPRKIVEMEVHLAVSVLMASRLKMVGHKLVTTLTAKLLMIFRGKRSLCQVMALVLQLVPCTMMEMEVIMVTSVFMAWHPPALAQV